jgi:hypothetical protein
MRKLLVSVPEDLYKLLKHHSVETDRTLSDIVTQVLRKALGVKDDPLQKRKES